MSLVKRGPTRSLCAEVATVGVALVLSWPGMPIGTLFVVVLAGFVLAVAADEARPTVAPAACSVRFAHRRFGCRAC